MVLWYCGTVAWYCGTVEWYCKMPWEFFRYRVCIATWDPLCKRNEGCGRGWHIPEVAWVLCEMRWFSWRSWYIVVEWGDFLERHDHYRCQQAALVACGLLCLFNNLESPIIEHFWVDQTSSGYPAKPLSSVCFIYQYIVRDSIDFKYSFPLCVIFINIWLEIALEFKYFIKTLFTWKKV